MQSIFWSFHSISFFPFSIVFLIISIGASAHAVCPIKIVDCLITIALYNARQSFFQEVSTASAEKQSEIFTNLVKQIEQNNPDIDMGRFWSIYQSKRKRFISITNGDSLTPYTPEQISSTLQSLLKQYALLEIAGIEGYRTLCKIAKMINK